MKKKIFETLFNWTSDELSLSRTVMVEQDEEQEGQTQQIQTIEQPRLEQRQVKVLPAQIQPAPIQPAEKTDIVFFERPNDLYAGLCLVTTLCGCGLIYLFNPLNASTLQMMWWLVMGTATVLLFAQNRKTSYTLTSKVLEIQKPMSTLIIPNKRIKSVNVGFNKVLVTYFDELHLEQTVELNGISNPVQKMHLIYQNAV